MAQVLIADPSLPISAALKKFLESAGHQVRVVHSVAEAVEAVRDHLPALAIASCSSHFDGESLCERLQGLDPICPVVLVFAPEEDRPEDRASRVGAEAFLVGPLKRAAVVSICQLVLKVVALQDALAAKPGHTEQLKALAELQKVREAQLLKSLEPARAREPKLLEAVARINGELAGFKGREAPTRDRIQALETQTVALTAEVERLKVQLKKANSLAPGSEVAFLKRFLPLEVKRGKRYQYPIAVVLIGLDRLDQRLQTSSAPEFQRATIRAEAMEGIYKVVRDIDLAVPFADDKYLVLLPHTPRTGALTVANRLQVQLSKLDAFEGGNASVGMASYEPKSWLKEHVSFGGLMREATTALIKASNAGGGRVEAAPAPEKKKRNRISIG